MSSDDTAVIPAHRLVRAASAPPPASTELAGLRLYLETYGCQMNVADSEMVVGMLGAAGVVVTDRAAEADVILLNTCAVRAKAEDRVVARAQELGSLKRSRPGLVLAVTGCMAEHLKSRLLERTPLVDLVVGPDSYRRLPELLQKARRRDRSAPVIDVRLDRAETYSGLSDAAVRGGDGVSGFVPVQRGCDKFCSFCVVPFTRGRERAVPPDEVVAQCRALAAAGYREVVLLGQTVNSYRHGQVGFAELLAAVAEIDGIARIRFTSPYPIDFTAAVIDAIADLPEVCKYVHLPVQSGSDRVLERMRRGYTVADYYAVVDRLRDRIPDLALSTDLMCGFSGEDDADHQATLDLMRRVRFDSAFMFVYSERELTHAAKRLPDDVPVPVKKQRIADIVALQEQISTELYQAHVGRRLPVLIHARSKRSDDQLVGRTDGFKAVILPGDAGPPGTIVDAVIERATMATLFGRVA